MNSICDSCDSIIFTNTFFFNNYTYSSVLGLIINVLSINGSRLIFESDPVGAVVRW